MNWDAIGSVAEVAGAIGVVASLVYLATQIRHSAKTAEYSTMRELFTAAGTTAIAMAEEPNREIVMKGLTGYRNLGGAEKFAFDSLMAAMMNIVESSIASSNVELLTDEAVENWGCYLRPRFFPYQGFRDWWDDSKGQVVLEFRTWIDSELSKSDPKKYFWNIK